MQLKHKLDKVDATPILIGGDFNCVEDGVDDTQRAGETAYHNAHGAKWKAMAKSRRLRDVHHTMRLGPNISPVTH